MGGWDGRGGRRGLSEVSRLFNPPLNQSRISPPSLLPLPLPSPSPAHTPAYPRPAHRHHTDRQQLSAKINNNIERQMVNAAMSGKLTIMKNKGGEDP